MKFDPKLLKKIVHSKLIACATEIGINNADKISKEMLIPAYLDAVEKAEGDAPGSSNANIINMYNDIITTLGLDQEESTPETPVEETPITPEPEPEPEPAPEPPAPPPPPVARRVGRPAATSAPAAPVAPTVAKTTAAPKAPKPEREKIKRVPPAPKSFSRWTVLADTLLSLKTGTLEELVSAADQSYADQGGKSNIKESAAVAKCGVALLSKMEIITVANGSFTVN